MASTVTPALSHPVGHPAAGSGGSGGGIGSMTGRIRPSAKKRAVFCVLAPCDVCGLEKSGIANALLSQERGLVTHLILDRATADATVEAL